MGRYEKAWQATRQRILDAEKRAGRAPGSVRLLAVSKTFPPSAIRDLHGSGQRAFGENYVQEARAKRDALTDLADIEWHLIGRLQTNKARDAAAFDWVESVDREALAGRLAAARPPAAGPLDVLVQVNASGEPAKGGVEPAGALALARRVADMPSLRLRGIMGIPEATGDEARLRAQFRQLKACYDACADAGIAVDTLSMGMSSDLEVAIDEGATEVRVGTAIFGTRERAED